MLKKTVLTFAFLTILTTFYGFNAQFSAPATDDALNALAAGKYKGDLPANTILTPHPGEAARLLGWRVVPCVDRGGALRSVEEIHQEIWGLTAPLLK